MKKFERIETGYHSSAVRILAEWTNGIAEKQFMVDGRISSVPDVTVYKEGILDSIYEVVYSNLFTGHKLGIIWDWCYRNSIELNVFEISADYILAQTKSPEIIRAMEYYPISLTKIQEENFEIKNEPRR
jgi:hypothetical protein